MYLKGEIVDIVFRNDDNGYTVIDLDCNKELITAVGKFPEIHEGELVELEGTVVKNSKYGEQFSVSSVKILPPNTLEGITKYLCSGLIRGVGPVTASNIVEMFKENTLNVIEFNPEILSKVRGVSKSKAQQIAESYIDIKKMQNAVMFLQSHNISTNMAVKIYKNYQDNTEEILNTNPYKLVEDIDGIGFLTADKIAQKIGIKPDSDFRFRAGIVYALKENSEKNGNTFLTKKMLLDNLEKLLGISQDNMPKIDEILNSLQFDGIIKQFDYENEPSIILFKNYTYEKYSAQKLLDLQDGFLGENIDLSGEIKEYETLNNIKLHEKQIEAVKMAVNSGVSVITGGPGTGKTTIVKTILHCINYRHKSVILLAPTGRAAKRLNESTGAEAKTIHRALDLDYKNGNGVFFTKNEQDPLSQDVIIIDETSMVDSALMYNLLRAIKRHAQLIIVGDKNQLPSVGAGNVLADILNSKVIPVIELTEIYRQSQDSYIITNAHLINSGKMPTLTNKSKDFFFENKTDSTEMLYTCVNLVTMRLPKFLNIEANKIQVLAPMKAGACGVDNLNKELQKVLNPSKSNSNEIITENSIFRVHDKVMQTVNNYEQEWTRDLEDFVEHGTGVFNGDIGNIININAQIGEVTVLFEDGRKSVYPRLNINELVLSYAITIHKSQGSEFDAVVIPILSGASIILTRNLLYTAVTRAKKLVVLVGNKYNIKRMIDNNYTQKRYSLLKSFLTNELIL